MAFYVLDKTTHGIVNVNKSAVAGSQNGEKERTKNTTVKAVGENLDFVFFVSPPSLLFSFFLPLLQSGSPRFHPHPLHSPPLAPGIFNEKESADLQVGAFPNILFK